MSRFRKIDPRIWNDEKFRSLSDRGKLVFFFLLTHPHMTPFGVMRATFDGLAAELGWHAPPFRDAILEGCRKGMVKVDSEAHCVAIPKFLKYNPPEAPNSVKAFAKTLDLVPECALKSEAIQALESLLGRMAAPFRDAFRDAIGDGWRHPSLITEPETEPEQEPESEQETEQDITPLTPLLGGRQLVNLWNDLLPHPPFARVHYTAKRIEQAARRLAEYPDREFWERVFQKAAASPFLRGGGDRGWVMNFDWLVRNDTNAHKVVEGRFDKQSLAERAAAEMVPDHEVQEAGDGEANVPGDHGVSRRSVRALLPPGVS